MVFYVLAIIISVVGLVIFYFKTPKSTMSIFEQNKLGISEKLQQQFIFAADNCRKENSPVSEKAVIDILCEATELINKESFVINDTIVEGCSYHVV